MFEASVKQNPNPPHDLSKLANKEVKFMHCGSIDERMVGLLAFKTQKGLRK